MSDAGGNGGNGGSQRAAPEQPRSGHQHQMLDMHLNTLWVHFVVILLGCWLLASPSVLGYSDAGGFGPRVDAITAERQLADPAVRARWMMWSDLASGVLLIAFGSLSLRHRHRWAQWGTCFTGIWLLFAPLLLWAPDAASTNNDLLVGSLAIAFSVLIPMMPGMSMASMAQQEDVPPGWNYSPSSWTQRLPIIALAFAGFFLARHLMAYQMGHIATVQEPFFGDGTRDIITSDISRAWPVADAGLGAVSYLLEALSGAMGDRRRWRTMPWMVGMFGLLVIPVGGVSIYFIMIQPILLGTWCTVCLITAAIMIAMLPYTFDEVLAMIQFMRRARHEGQSTWKIFWHGGTMRGATIDDAPELQFEKIDTKRLKAAACALPQGLLLCAALGAWLMFTRVLFGTEGQMANSDHIAGGIVFTVSIAALSEVARPLRVVNIVVGLWLVIAPWVLDGASTTAGIAGVIVGSLLVLLSVPRGPVRNTYAGWDDWLL